MNAGWVRPILEALLGVLAAILALAGRAGARRRARDDDRGEHPARLSGAGWSVGLSDGPLSRRGLLADDGVDGETRSALASAWLDAARRAHDALAASTQRALDLVSLQAPPELVARAHEDALDDLRRVEIRLGVARAIDARTSLSLGAQSRGPALPRGRAAALALLAAEIVVDAALVECRSSRVNAKLARRTPDRTIRAALQEIAASEARRGAHLWAVVRWCVGEGGGAVEHALRALVGRWPSPPRELPVEALDGGWERWGIAGAALQRQEHTRACEVVERNIHELVASASRRGRLAAA